ncbi:hypothetical protein UFOVP353_47 [uncultured Caudovirales phage]|uniref:Uncharacterized protein n=1 Tax=uncultured Caudovirales phage TaxID=2100421 RepID=A0A6J5M115_9CAUD|nr:hypothetical protein UFOVP353_47 [uncultured Caudovirales phage]
MVPFIIFFSWIVAVGPVYNEGGDVAIEQKGFKAAVTQAWKNREPVDYSKMND